MTESTIRKFVAIGDSFTEGLGDPYPDGSPRGWADLVALGLSAHNQEPIQYANLAVRGKLMQEIIDEQLQAAIALKPDLLAINGGGNNMLRPSFNKETIGALYQGAVEEAQNSGITVIAISGPDPGGHLPGGTIFSRRGNELTSSIMVWAQQHHLTSCNNFADSNLRQSENWSPDGLHLNTRGHAKVAQNILKSLNYPAFTDLDALIAQEMPVTHFGSARFYNEHVIPWMGRRIRRASSGNGRHAKHTVLTTVDYQSFSE